MTARPLTKETLGFILGDIEYKGWEFFAGDLGDGFYIQCHFKDANGMRWTGRKWYVSSYSTRSEVVQTALKAILTAEEHEAREAFTYKGYQVFQPHFDVERLAEFASIGKAHMDVRG